MNDEEKYLKEAKRNHILFIIGLTMTMLSFALGALLANMFLLLTIMGLIIVVYTTIEFIRNRDKWPEDLVGGFP
jgi:hypothetical protein